MLRISKSLTRFISRQEFRFGLLTSNLRLDSPHFRYALRVTAAAALAMTLASRWLSPAFSAHNYWIMLTIVIIMKPGFALTRQRNGWRLTGTVIGCVCALLLFNLTDSPEILFAVLLAACIMGNSLVQLNYMASAIFNTLFVVLVFHFVSPGTVSMSVIGERAIDTLIGCALALVCSYILPLVGGPLSRRWRRQPRAPTASTCWRACATPTRCRRRPIPRLTRPGTVRPRPSPTPTSPGGWRARTCTSPSAISPRRSTA